MHSHQKSSSWYQDGDNLLNENLAPDPINKKAKGVILFVGDGMSVATVTAARVLDGQLKGMAGTETLRKKIMKNAPDRNPLKIMKNCLGIFRSKF